MKILHTADIHLRTKGDERWQTLESLVLLGRKEGIDLLVVSGDLFDGEGDAEELRPAIREVFSQTGFKIVLIPGNHDRDAYRKDVWFGEDVVVLTRLDAPFEYKTVRIWGMPFEPIGGEEILRRLRILGSRLASDRCEILLYHGELLDAFFSRGDFGEEGEERYMPVKLSYFKDLDLDYVLAGHFHSRIHFWSLAKGGYFVYPGSPVSITRRERGRRKVNLFEPGSMPSEYPLDSPHFEEVVIELDPFGDEKPLEVVRGRLGGICGEARIILTVKGFLNGRTAGMGESRLVEEIKGICGGRCVEEHYEFKDIESILEDDLFRSFVEKLGRIGYKEREKEEVLKIATRAMMDAMR
ncbi:MAG: metallophosphoesterase [Deltaproteobacteria bacterium]|nr:metallophosphoesterase [Deltaproteobacteria bacterium]